MDQVLNKYLPERAVEGVFELVKMSRVHLKIVNQRHTKHGDYRRMPDGRHVITVNNTLNKYAFLITLVHELAHLFAFEKYGRFIKPHGKEWKHTFQHLMLPFIRPEVFPADLLPFVAHHFKSPKASSSTDAQLAIALKKYDEQIDLSNCYIFELLEGDTFRIPNGQVFLKGKKLRKRYQCLEIKTKKMYLFQPNAMVEPLR